jgi:hypothetical protein
MTSTSTKPATGDRGPRQELQSGWIGPAVNSQPCAKTQALHAELIGSDICTSAGITARSPTPVLALCREMIAAGLDPDRALEVYRGATLALRVRSIGAAAKLEINSKGTDFAPRGAVRTASPVRLNGGRAA